MSNYFKRLNSLFNDNQLNWVLGDIQCLFEENKDKVEDLVKTQPTFIFEVGGIVYTMIDLKKFYKKWGYEKTPYNSDILDRYEEDISSYINKFLNIWETKYGLSL